jgi:hypothetical protein
MHSISLEGVTDLHVHTAPDVQPRLFSDIEMAREAAAAGMRAIVLKSHHTLTADRAALAEAQVPGIRVFGGLALNDYVGGLNPAAVETALVMGARIIWMPTFSSANENGQNGRAGHGISILDSAGRLLSAVSEILRLIAQADVILASGHLSVQETCLLVEAARAARIQRILINHPELPVVNMPVTVQQQLAGPDVFFERCSLATIVPPSGGPPATTVARIAADIRRIGPESTVLATDFGQPSNPSPIEGLRLYIAALRDCGFSQAEIDRMARVNPAWLLGLNDIT